MSVPSHFSVEATGYIHFRVPPGLPHEPQAGHFSSGSMPRLILPAF